MLGRFLATSAQRETSPNDQYARNCWYGARALGNNELVALVLGSGCHQRDALVVTQRAVGGPRREYGLVQAGCDDLARVGDRACRAAQIVAAVGGPPDAGPSAARVAAPDAAAGRCVVDAAFSGRAVEQFGVVLLDTRHRVLRTTVLTVGTLNTAASGRATSFARPLGGAAALFVFNHPSGDPPSQTMWSDAPAGRGRCIDGHRCGRSSSWATCGTAVFQDNGAL
jgi:DNA repair protein RadC